MATVTALGIGQSVDRETPKLALSNSRGAIGAILFLMIAFILLAAGAATGAPLGSGAPVEAGAFILDPAIGPARG